MPTVQTELERPAAPAVAAGLAKSSGPPATGVTGEPTTLLAVRYVRQDAEAPHVTSAQLREHDAVVRAGLWGVALSTLAVLVVSALMGLMRG